MFNRNEWLQWAQQSQNNNTEMNDFRSEYWRKNDATKSYMNPKRTVRENSQKNEPVELNEGPVGNFVKWVSGTHGPVLRNRAGDVVKYPEKYPTHYVHGPNLGKPHPKAGEDLPKSKAGKPIKIKPGDIWKDRTKELTKTGAHLAGQVVAFGGLRGAPKEKPEPVGRTSREFETESIDLQRKAQQLKNTQKNLEEKGTEPDKLSDLQELGAQGWKNVATGAKVVDKLSDLAMIGGVIAAPFTGGLSLAATGAGLAAKTGAKVGTKLITKQATKMATKQATKQATNAVIPAVTKQATKTGTQKATDIVGRIGTDVATYGAVSKMSGGGKPKQDTTTQIEPNKIQQKDTSPLAKIGANTSAQQNSGKLAASYDPEGTELNEVLGRVLFKGGKVINKKSKLTPLPGRTPVKPPVKPPVSTGNPATPPGNVSTSTGNPATSAGNAAPTTAPPTTAPKPPETGREKWKRRGKATTKSVLQSGGTALAFTALSPKQQVDTTAQIQNPTGTARDR